MDMRHDAGAVTDQPDDRTSPVAWWMLAVLLLFYVLSYFDRYVITMLVTPIKADLGLSDFQMSLILGPAFAAVFAIFGLPLGWAADRWDRRLVIFCGVIVWSLGAAGGGVAAGMVSLFVARMAVGVGEAALSPAAYSLIGDKFPRKRVATANSIYETGVKLGSAAAFAIGAAAIALAEHHGLAAIPGVGVLHPWQQVLLFTGAPGVLLAFLVFTFAEPVRRERTVKPAGASVGHDDDPDLWAFCRGHARLLSLMVLAFGLIALCAFSLTAWTPTYISRTFGWKPAQYGPALSLISFIAAATLVVRGAVLDWLVVRGIKDAYLRFYSWLLTAALPIVAAVYAVRNIYLFFVLFALVQIIVIPLMTYLVSTIHQLAPSRLRGRLIAFFLLVTTLVGQGGGPVVVGAVTDFVFHDERKVGWSLALLLCTAVPIALIALRLALRPLREALER